MMYFFFRFIVLCFSKRTRNQEAIFSNYFFDLDQISDFLKLKFTYFLIFFLLLINQNREMIPVIPVSSGLDNNFSRLFNHNNYGHGGYAAETVYTT